MIRISHKSRSLQTHAAITAGGCVVIMVCSLVWMGCSIEKHYSTLSFFFDGVPNPEAKARAAAAAGVTPDLRNSPTYSLHKPYAEEQCNECHADQLKITNRDSEMCLKCHQDEPSKFPKMHGPVAAGACLWCHSPHESAQAHLMRKPARDVCMQCHDRTMLSLDRVPAHGDEKISCIDCHSGHGGNASMFLKEGVSRPAPEAPASQAQPR